MSSGMSSEGVSGVVFGRDLGGPSVVGEFSLRFVGNVFATVWMSLQVSLGTPLRLS